MATFSDAFIAGDAFLGYNTPVRERRVASPPGHPVLIFDGECGFCRFWVAKWRHRTGNAVEYQPFQSSAVAERFPDVPRERSASAVQLVEADGRVFEAAEAVFRLLAAVGARWPLRLYERAPGVRAITERAYRLIADHRDAAARVTILLWGRVSEPSTYALARWWFFRLLGVTYLAAFGSLATQIVGLAGSNGILPAGVGDVWLHCLCVGGVVLASLLVAGIGPVAILVALWADYLALSVIGGPFLAFQWDSLLLEAGFLSILLAPAGLRDRVRTASDPPRLAVWLMLWLLFRLMVGSGAVKLTSGDPTWRSFTALSVHYETQPLPTLVAWHAHWMPPWFQHSSTAVVLAIELCAPWLMLGPRRLRTLAFVLLVGLQVAIALTGNYAFFNLLSAALCVFLLDDAVLARRSPVNLSPAYVSRGCRFVVIAVAVVTVPVSALMLSRSLGLSLPGRRLVLPVARAIAPLRSVNSYGLFAVMTTVRPEIIVEGSMDGEVWRPYEFRYKPGDLTRPPAWVAPHQPRLDWQMWFAALDRYGEETWFQNFCARLLQGSPDVLRLIERDPFHGRPPRYVRSVLYRYKFADPAERRAEGVWWTRERLGVYAPVMSLPGTGGP
ncbi:MAG: DUF393 domain-containing protein [Luteitalea sp.]|nr:DUF393 domain-containing protein [Luteitalea sp.]